MKDDKKIELNEETIRAYNAGNLFAPEVNVEQYNDSKFKDNDTIDNASDLLDLVEKDNLVKKDEIKKGK